jgi:hypothetical protein
MRKLVNYAQAKKESLISRIHRDGEHDADR